MRLLALLVVLLVLPATAFAQNGGAAVTKVYIYDRPEISVSLTESDGTLICAWDIEDLDEDDSFTARVLWTKDGEEAAVEKVDCGMLRHCAALERPEPQAGETWKCSVTVQDNYNATATGSAEFYRAPLGFFSGLLERILSFFGLA